MAKNRDIEIAYKNAIDFTKSHYENFPVISVFVPKNLQKHVAIVYQFARQADDIADEGNYSESERVNRLNDYEKELANSLNGIYSNKFWMGLANTINDLRLSTSNFKNLLIAFRQDITKKEYESFEELLDYCKYSANPVGRIILEINQVKSNEALEYSDSICTALQITNFLQDVAVDFEKGRIYLPKADLAKHDVKLSIFNTKIADNNFRALIESEIKKVQKYFENGKKLLPYLPFRSRQQIKWTIRGGIGILIKIENLKYDVLNSRPKFSKIDFVKLLLNLKIY